MAANSTWSLQTRDESFRIKYGKLAEVVFNAGHEILSQVKVNEKFVGKSYVEDQPLGFSGSVGSRKLPLANTGKYANSILYSKKVYGRVYIDRESLKAASTSEGAFYDFMDRPMEDLMMSYDRNRSRMLFGDGTAILGYGDAGAADVTGAGTVGSPYVVTFTAAKFNEGNWEEGDYVQIVTGINALGAGGTAEGGDNTTNLLEVVSVDPVNYTVSLVGTSAILAARVASPAPLGATDAIVMQRSYEGDMTGLRKLSKYTVAWQTGTTGLDLYGIPLQRRWSMYVKDESGANISTAILNNNIIQVKYRSGRDINLIASSYTQYAKMLELAENDKRYPMVPVNAKYATFGFDAVQYMTPTGPVPVIMDRMCQKDEIWLLNTKYMEFYLRPGGIEFAEEDGTTFLRSVDEDTYEARLASYGELFISPGYQGHIKNLSI